MPTSERLKGMKMICSAAGLLTAGMLTGCAGKLPAGYVKARADYGLDLRAVSAEGSALTLRTEENPENGDLVFWEKAVHTRLTEVRGYQAVRRTEIRNGSTSGIELTYDYTRAGVDYGYLVAILVRGSRVYVFEAAGPKPGFTADGPELRKAITAWPL